MPRSPRIPKYRHYKPKNLGVVRINGHDFYLGTYNSPESWEKYHRLIAEHLAGNPPPRKDHQADQNGTGFSINQLLVRYLDFATTYYQKDGEPTMELESMRYALKPLRQLYGNTAAVEFGPLKLKTLREHMIDVQDLCRNEINKRVGRIKRFFRWAVSEELVPPSVAQGLNTVTGLKKHKSPARETEKVKPVSDADVEAVFPYLPPHLIAMINIQRLTGMRPGEVVLMRVCDIDRDSQPGVWIYFPDRHKKDWLDEPRAIAIGPQGQSVLEPFLDRPKEAYLFSPAEAYQWRLDNRTMHTGKERKTPIYPCELRAREKAKKRRRRQQSKRKKGDRYTPASYRKALNYGFQKAAKKGVQLNHWFPYQLRHSRGTELRKKYGVEASRVTLGHTRLDATEIYAEKDLMQAIQIAREAG